MPTEVLNDMRVKGSSVTLLLPLSLRDEMRGVLFLSAVTPIAMFEAENDVVQYGHTAGTARESGKQFNIPECHVWTVVDGKVARARFYIDSAAMLDALAP